MSTGLTIRQRAIKRSLDVVVATVGLALLWPVIAVSAALARIETGEPGFFSQIRVGRHGRRFVLWKIRTMRSDATHTSTVTAHGDPRVTRWGRVLRRTKIDELPQLLNVLRGDMSIVGPRPDVPGFHDRLQGDDRILLSVRPGITGAAALCFRDEERLLATVADPVAYSADVLFPRKVVIDRAYVEQYRVVRDLGIMLATLACALPWSLRAAGARGDAHAPLVRDLRDRGWRVPPIMVDQGVSSLTNLLMSLAAARYLTPHAFGAFTVAFLCYVVVLGVTRGLTSEALVVRHSLSDTGAQRRAFDAVLGATVAAALAAASALCLVGLLLPDDVAVAIIALAVVLPGLLLQDTMRFVAVSCGRAGEAVRNDVAWFACSAVAVSCTVLLGQPHAVHLVLAWGAGAAVAGVVSGVRLAVRPRLTQAGDWFTAHWDIGGRFAGEFLALQGSGQLALSLVAATGSLRDLAALQGANLLFGPFGVLVMGLRQLAVPGLARARARAPERFRSALVSITLVTTVVALLIGAAVLLTPDVLGRQVLGETWSGARDLAVPVTAHKAVIGIGLGSLCALRVLAAARESMQAQLITGALFVVAGPVGAVHGGAVGAAWGMAGAQAVGSALYVHAYRRATGRSRRGGRREETR